MKNKNLDIKKGITIFLFLLPGLALFVSILIAPIAVSVYRSMYDWNGFTEGTFIGFNNYVELFTNGSIKLNAFSCLATMFQCSPALPR